MLCRGKRWRMCVFTVLNVILAVLLAAPVNASQGTAAAAAWRAADPRPGEVTLLGADAQGVRLELDVPDFALAAPTAAAPASGAGSACQQAQATGFVQSQEAGRPQVPVKVVLLGVPPNAEFALDVEASAARTIASGVTLCAASPVPVAEEREGSAAYSDAGTGAAAVLDAEVYGADVFYPSEMVRLIDLGFMRSQRIIRLEIYPLQFNPVAHELRASDHIEVAVRFQGDDFSAAGPVAEPEEFEAAFRHNLLNYQAARSWRDRSGTAVAAATAAWTPPQPGYKILVREEGLYQLTRTDLAAAGLPVTQLDPRTLRMFNETQEVAIRVIGQDDGVFDAQDVVLFFGQGADTRYTDTNVYWLTHGGALGLRMSTRNSVAGGTATPTFFSSVKKEDNTVYDVDLPLLPGYDHWYGQQISAVGANNRGSASINVATPELAAGSADASVSVMLGAITAGTHHVRIYINPTSHPASVFDGTWDGINTVHLISASFPQSYLSSTGSNVVKIELINDQTGRAADLVRLDWVRVGYQRNFVAANDRLFFGGDTPGARRYNVTGFSSNDIELYDVTDPLRTARIDWTVEPPAGVKLFLPLVLKRHTSSAAAWNVATVSGKLAASTLVFGDNQTTPRRYLAQVSAQRLSPLSITLDQPSSLQASSLGADTIIITHADFKTAIQPLANLRSSQGLRVQIVDVQDIYDEFGGGLMSAEAIHDFVAYAYGAWARPAPKSVLLVGDGTYDFRHYRYATPTFIPPYLEMVDIDGSETATDNRFVTATAGDVLPDLDIGRLPVNSPAETTAMVNKILAYEAQSSAAWMQQVLFITDDLLDSGGGNFYEYSDGIADGYASHNGSSVKILPTEYTPNKVYMGQTCDLADQNPSVECRAQIIDKINAGSLLVSYVGHGQKTYWALEHLYDAAALANISNAGRLPVLLPMTCYEGYFVDPAETSLAELGVRAENKGAVASWSPTGYGLAPGHDFLERGFFLALFYDQAKLGAAATQGKLYLVANASGNYLDLVDTFALFGDPDLRVPVQ